MSVAPNLPTRKFTIPEIKQAVCKRFGVALHEMDSRSHFKAYTQPRQVAMYLAREMTTRSLPYIGTQFGRDHTTVIHAVRAVGGSEKRKTEADALRATMEGWAAVFAPTDHAGMIRQQKEACEAVAAFIRSLNINICNCHYCTARARGLA